MDFKEKLEKAAYKHAVYSDVNWENYTYHDLESSFKAGAEWLQSQPIADRLTKMEREKIKEMYADLIPLKGHMAGIVGQMVLLEKIFGKEIFGKEE